MNTIIQKIIFFCAVFTVHTVFMLQAQNTNPVGAIPGVIDVSPMGAATYTIPIEVVPGTQGMQPNLSIVYNSMGGMGLLGMKWNLAGLSAITRCMQTPYYDDKIAEIKFGIVKIFALDGQRLITTNTINVDGIQRELATEMENFMRVYAYGADDRTYPTTHFTAYTDDGSIIEYGHTNDSKQKLSTTNGSVLSWYINKITDANGNYMTFTYQGGSSGDIGIKEINYTGNLNNNMETYAKVEFRYTSLSMLWGHNTHFVSGYGISQYDVLDKIIISYKDTVVRKYEFEYNMNIWNALEGGTAHLEKIVLSGVEGTKQLNPTAIEWGNKNTSIEEKTINVMCAKTITGDFNGDGHSDIIYYAEQGTLQGYYGEQGWDLMLYNPTTKLFEAKASERNVDCVIMHAQDINGDGKDELIIGNTNSTNDTIFLKILSLPSKTQIGSTLKYRIYDSPLSSFCFLGHIDFGDFDGDGTTDILLYEADGKGFTPNGGTTIPNSPYLLTLKKVVGNQLVNMCNPLNIGVNAKIKVLDANGSGKKNIQVEQNGTTKIYEFNGSYLETINTNPAYHSYSHKYYGDVNGDGITDVLVFCYENQEFKWKIFIAKGDGTFLEGIKIYPEANTNINVLDATAANPSAGNNSAPKYEPRFADINGDGKEDIIQRVGNNFTILYSKMVGTYFIGGTIWGLYGFIKETISFDNPSNYYTNWCLGDFDGVRKLKILLTHPQKSPFQTSQKTISINHNSDYEFVKQITDGAGKRIQLDYEHKYYNDVATNQKHFLSIVNSLKISNGIGTGLNTFQYQYQNFVFSLSRRSILGFKNFTTKNIIENKTDSFIFAADNTKQIMKPVSQKTLYNTASYYETDYNIVNLNLPKNRFILYCNEIQIINKLNNTKTISTTTLFNSGDNIGRVNTTNTKNYNSYNAPSASWMHSETSTFTYGTIILNGYQRKTVPTKILTTQQYGSSGIVIADTLTYNYSGTGRLNWQRQGNLDGSIKTDYGNYTVTGLYREKTVSAAGVTPRKEYYEYDNNTNRFVTKIKNHLLHENTMTYDAKTGSKLTGTSANGLTPIYIYDNFGRLEQVNNPTGTVTTNTIYRHTTPNLPDARYCSKTTSTGKPESIVYYDVLGREVCRFEDGCYYDTRYNAKGQVVKTSYPYQNQNTPDASKIWSEYTYDDYGRKDAVTAPYINLTYKYNDRKVTVTDHLRNKVTSYKDYDALGRIIEAKDEGGTITYSYTVINDNNKRRHQTTITTNGATTQIISDLWGNRLSISEPNAGTITSEYNGFNELVEQKDANNNTTKYQYDALGRVTQENHLASNVNMQTIKYIYDTSDKGKGKLHKIIRNSVEAEIFSYDAYSRLRKLEKLVDTESYVFRYTYKANGQLETFTYPDNFSITYSYNNTTGKLNDIRRTDDNSLIYKVGSRDKYNAPTKCEYGNGIITNYTYNPYGLLTRINTGKNLTYTQSDTASIENPHEKGSAPVHLVADSSILNYRYAYNDKGLMISRSESVLNHSELFYYDDLDRLELIVPNDDVMQAQFMWFAKNGNITQNFPVGKYSYSSNKPHAVSSITNPHDAISKVQCDVGYNVFNQPSQITEGTHRLNLYYRHDQQRYKSLKYRNNVLESTRYYITKYYEKEVATTTRRYYYIYGDHGVVALRIATSSTDSMYYIHTDHLGSYCAITNANKQVRQRNYFDSWGNFKRIVSGRNGFSFKESAPSDSLGMGTLASFNFTLTNRGFTGHEHYPYIKIINMNGRLYDPIIARFFSPDKYVANSTFTQDYNRYTYARNNPLMYTDPDGEFPILAAVFGGMAMNALTYIAGAAANNFDWDWGQFAFTSLSGATTGAIGAGIGMGLSAIGVGGFFNGLISGTVTGTANGLINGLAMKSTTGIPKDFWRSFGIGVGMGAVVGGLWGGIDAAMDGRTFWNGARLRQVGFNHNIPSVIQDAKGCLLANMQADNIMNGGMYSDEQLSACIVLGESGYADATASWKKYHELTGRSIIEKDLPSQTFFGKEVMKGRRVSMNLYQFDEYGANIPGHSVMLSDFKATEVIRVNGTVVYKNISGGYMNPLTGLRDPFKWWDIKGSIMYFLY